MISIQVGIHLLSLELIQWLLQTSIRSVNGSLDWRMVNGHSTWSLAIQYMHHQHFPQQ